MDQSVEKNDLRILMLEDVPSDAELEEGELRDSELVFTMLRVDTREAFVQALDEFKPNIVLADYNLPAYNGRDALEYSRRTHPQIPVIMVTGAMGDEAAVDLLKMGAKDYVLKDRLARLVPAIKRAISEEAGVRNRKLAEGKYRALFAEARDGIVMIDCETEQMSDCNPEFERMSGRTLDELKAIKIWKLSSLEKLRTAREVIQQIKKTGSHNGELELRKPDGTILPLEISAKVINLQGNNFIQAIARDITERRQAERALRESEMRYRRLFEAAKDGILILDAATGKVMDANPFFLDLLSTSRSECVGKMLWEISLFPDTADSKAAFRELLTNGYLRFEDFPLETKDGRKIDVEFISNIYEIDEQKVIQCNIRDITQRLHAERALRDSEEKFRSITASANDAILVIDNEGRISHWNAAAGKIFGYPAHEAFGRALHTLLAPERFHDDIRKGFSHFRESGEGQFVGKTVELAGIRKDGTEFPLELSLSAIKRGGLWNAIGIVRDISERKHAEQIIRDEKTFSDTLIQSLPDIFYLVDQQGSMLRWNNNTAELAGLSPDEMSSANAMSFIHEEDRSLVTQKLEQAFETGSAETEARLTLKKGLRHYVLTATRIETQRGVGVIGIGVDITERKLAEESLHRANRALRTLSAGNLALVRAASEEELLRAVTSVVVENGGYRMAAVCYAEDDPEKSITPMAWHGSEDRHYWAERLSWDDTERGQLPLAKAIRSGTPQICRNIASDPGFAPWKDAALVRGYVSNIALPLSGGGRIFGGLCIYSSRADTFDDEEEVRLLEELSSDLAYGIVTLRTRTEHEQHATILRQSLEQSIQTIASTVEARDPYTAGHQRRVGELAAAIAREMGLPYEQVEGIHLAAIIHDLGKIHIPAEILAKPGKLSDIEFMLIKSHPQAGYDILKDVKFPWPIADIILQHHERLDGSGYPQRLKDGEILLESKIMAVADVVEAMSSHRPYRPALGIESALMEIERGRGSVYDPAIVDVCLRLFAKKGFKFSGASS